LERGAAESKRRFSPGDPKTQPFLGPQSGLASTGCYNYCYYMAYKTKVRKIGNSLGIVIPKEALRAMKVEEGATLYITEAPGGAVQVTPDQEHFGEMMKIAERGMQKYRNALRELAK
jgi:putative addiction module antidote